MELQAVPTPMINWNATNLAEVWRKFEQHVRLILDGPLSEKTEPVKIKYLLIWVGEDGRDIYDTWNLSADDKKKLDKHFEKFQQHVQPKKNSIFARYRFNEERQGNESIEQFVTRIRLIVKDCGFKEPNEMIRDRIVFGTNSQKVKERLINEGDNLTLEKAIQIGQTYEYSQEQLKKMGALNSDTSAGSADIHSMKTRYKPNTHNRQKPSNRQYSNRSQQAEVPKKTLCGNCGYEHSKTEKCPAKGKQCSKCKKWHHFAKACRSKSVHGVQTTQPYDEIPTTEDFFIDSIQNGSRIQEDQAFADLNIKTNSETHVINFKLDTGSQVNILPNQSYCKFNKVIHLFKPERTLSAYNGKVLPSLGVCRVPCSYKGSSQVVEFYVVKTRSPPILGMKSCLDFGLIRVVYALEGSVSKTKPHDQSCLQPNPTPLSNEIVLQEYPDLFTGVGLLPGEANIQVNPDVTPVVHPPRRVPVALRDKLKDELDRMQDSHIIAKVDVPTPWVNSLVIVEKPGTGKLRVCLDPQDLNNAIVRPHYPMRTLEDILPKLTGAQYFTKLDARSGYWTIQLSESSSFLTTFNTPFGRYRFKRLPFGLNCSQDLFQSKMDEILEGMDGVVAIVDDILVYGSSREEHDAHLREVLAVARKRGLKLNDGKLNVGVQEVSYFGHVLTLNGLKPDPNKVSAIRDMPEPKTLPSYKLFLE